MIGKDITSILVTFVIGFLVGVYLYLNGFATTFALPEATTMDTYSEFVIIGENYGACHETNTCLSFQVLKDGDYRSLYDSKDGEEKLVQEGKIPGPLRRELFLYLTHEALEIESEPYATPNCYYKDGTNARFRVTLDEMNYVLDTCESQIDYEGNTWPVLVELWNYFASLEYTESQ